MANGDFPFERAFTTRWPERVEGETEIGDTNLERPGAAPH
jgi:hypothetical protein